MEVQRITKMEKMFLEQNMQSITQIALLTEYSIEYGSFLSSGQALHTTITLLLCIMQFSPF